MRKTIFILNIFVFSAFINISTYTTEKFGIAAVPILFVFAAGVQFLEMVTAPEYSLINYHDRSTYVISGFFLLYLTIGLYKADLFIAYYEVYMILIGFLIFHLIITAVQTKSELESLLLTILISSPVLALQGVYQFLHAVSLPEFNGYYRAAGWWYGPNEYAVILSFIYLISFYFIDKEKKILRWAGYLSHFSVIIGILLSLSRGGLVVFGLISLFNWRSFRRHKEYTVTLVILAIVITLVLFLNILHIDFIDKIPIDRLFLASEEDKADVSNGRLAAALGGLYTYANYPLTGVGFGNILHYADAFNEYKTYSHNMFIEIMAASGTIPALSYCFMLFYLWYTTPKERREKVGVGQVMKQSVLVIVATSFVAHYLLELKPFWILLSVFPIYFQLSKQYISKDAV